MGDVFAVDKILQQRTFNGRVQYLIKWAGYGSTFNTWEPAENVLPFTSKKAIQRDLADEKRLAELVTEFGERAVSSTPVAKEKPVAKTSRIAKKKLAEKPSARLTT